eukprot:superscaffoldBa00000005_g105
MLTIQVKNTMLQLNGQNLKLEAKNGRNSKTPGLHLSTTHGKEAVGRLTASSPTQEGTAQLDLLLLKSPKPVLEREAENRPVRRPLKLAPLELPEEVRESQRQKLKVIQQEAKPAAYKHLADVVCRGTPAPLCSKPVPPLLSPRIKAQAACGGEAACQNPSTLQQEMGRRRVRLRRAQCLEEDQCNSNTSTGGLSADEGKLAQGVQGKGQRADRALRSQPHAGKGIKESPAASWEYRSVRKGHHEDCSQQSARCTMNRQSAEGCKNVHYDLAFILDTSSSVGKENFEKIRQWVANLVESFDVAPDKTRVAVVRYSDTTTTEFNLGKHRTLEDVKRAARNIRYLGGNTMTGDAISYTTTNIFTERNGARPIAKGIQRVAILLTDGRSQDYVLEPSKDAAKAGIRMFAVGIGEALKEELEEIAAEPKNAHVFHVTDFNAIDKIRGRLRRRLCENVLCPNMKVQPDRFKPDSTSYGLEEVPGFDLMDYFNVRDILGTRVDDGQSSYVRLGTMPIVQQTEDVFPQGLPDEYAFVTTFKFRKTSRREDWYLWQVFDKYGIPQVSIRLDGENKAVEYNAVGLTKDAVRAVFKNPEVDNLFDRNWHKIALSVDAKSVSLYLDCKHIQTLPIGDREDIDIQGKTVIGKRLYDSVPIDFDLQRMMIYCDSKHAELETCCDLPNGPCPKKIVTEAPPLAIPTPTPTSVEQQRGPQVNCSCPAGEKSWSVFLLCEHSYLYRVTLALRAPSDHLASEDKKEKLDSVVCQALMGYLETKETKVQQDSLVNQDCLVQLDKREFKGMQEPLVHQDHQVSL